MYRLLLCFCAVALFTSCEKEDPTIPVEPELITNVEWTLTPHGGGTTVVMTYQDLDGDGGNAPTIVGGTLLANTTYHANVTLSNQLESPAEDITVEVREEGEEHQFFFAATGAEITVAYADEDAANQPIGLHTEATTGNASTGNITITLRHEPNKAGANVAQGDITNAGGETDVEITFPIEIQ